MLQTYHLGRDESRNFAIPDGILIRGKESVKKNQKKVDISYPVDNDDGMEWSTWYKSLSQAERAKYAKKAGTSQGYIEVSLLRSPPRKTPKVKLLYGLYYASPRAITWARIRDHFIPPPPQKGAKK